MSVDVKYTTTAIATGGREGEARTEDGAFSVKLSTPRELGGAGGEGNNPEQLFAAGYAACFLGAMKVAARGLGMTVPADAHVRATVGIGPRAEGGFGIKVALDAELPDTSPKDALRIVEGAHAICPYSNATRGNVEMAVTVMGQVVE